MPRKDRYGNDFIHHQNFPNDPGVRNIEFAAGKSFFGKREFPSCYLTDLNEPPIDHFMAHPNDYELLDCHYLDSNCDFLSHPLGNRTFENVIFCNPCSVGFRGRGNTKNFLEKAHTILAEDGVLTILGNSTNGWASFENLDRHYKKLRELGQLAHEFIYGVEKIDDTHQFRRDHSFFWTNLQTPAIPNELIKIKKG